MANREQKKEPPYGLKREKAGPRKAGRQVI
jgi:hypothetical protein